MIAKVQATKALVLPSVAQLLGSSSAVLQHHVAAVLLRTSAAPTVSAKLKVTSPLAPQNVVVWLVPRHALP